MDWVCCAVELWREELLALDFNFSVLHTGYMPSLVSESLNHHTDHQFFHRFKEFVCVLTLAAETFGCIARQIVSFIFYGTPLLEHRIGGLITSLLCQHSEVSLSNKVNTELPPMVAHCLSESV